MFDEGKESRFHVTYTLMWGLLQSLRAQNACERVVDSTGISQGFIV